MHVMLGGKFEYAVIRAIDAQNNVPRNDRASGYYGGLNRRTPKSFLDRAATFLMLAEEVLIAGADWSDVPSPGVVSGVSGSDLGLRHEFGRFGEWDEEGRSLAKAILDKNLLSEELIAYITDIILSDIPKDEGRDFHKEYEDGKLGLAEHYLCRLFMQIRTVQGTKIALVLDESDIEIISQIGAHIRAGRLSSYFEFPEANGTIILGHHFGGPLLCFSPPDALAIAAIRKDAQIQSYAESVRHHIGHADNDDETQMIRAMAKTYRAVGKRRKIDTFFDVSGWVAKPINYVPFIGNVASAIADAADVAQLGIKKDIVKREWYLIAARATQVGIEDYLSRQHNLLG
jgi:hypothetical protein